MFARQEAPEIKGTRRAVQNATRNVYHHVRHMLIWLVDLVKFSLKEQ